MRTSYRNGCAMASLLAAMVAAGCGGGDTPAAPPANGKAPVVPAPAPAPVPEPPGKGMKFEEVAQSTGMTFFNTFLRPEQGENFKINLYDHGSGTCVADIDGDGWDDLYLLNQLGANALFRNKGDGTFEDVTARSGVALESVISVAAVFGDVDADGDQDLFVTTTRGGQFMFLNDGKGVFKDVTKESGLVHVGHAMSPAFFDADMDGDIDLFVSYTAGWTLDEYSQDLKYYRGKADLQSLINSPRELNRFYRNDGRGVFTEGAEAAGVGGDGCGGDVVVFDADGDGDLDLFVCNMFGRSHLYRNDGKAKFTEATKEMLGYTSWGAVGARSFDYDGDGLMDLYVVDMHSDMWMPFDIDPLLIEEDKKYKSFMARAVALRQATMEDDRKFAIDAGIPEKGVVFGNTLYRNLGNGRFEETSDEANAETFWPWGVADGDFDNDGFEDAFIPSGMGYPLFHWRNALLHNRGDGTFEDVCRRAGVDPPPGGPEMDLVFRGKKATRSSRSAAVADFDRDGRPDLVVNNFNERAYHYRNRSERKHWLEFRLKATRSHPDAVGALVYVTTGDRRQVRMVQTSGGYLAQSTAVVHFGLGDATTVDKVEIRWPSGQVQELSGVKIDTYSTVTEPPR